MCYFHQSVRFRERDIFFFLFVVSAEEEESFRVSCARDCPRADIYTLRLYEFVRTYG